MSEQYGNITTIEDSDTEDEELSLVMVSREHEEITALLPELGKLHKSLREIDHTEYLGTIEDTIGYLSTRLQEMWGEYTVQLGLGKVALHAQTGSHNEQLTQTS